MTTRKEALDCLTNFPYQNLRKCIENSMENVHADVMVKIVNQKFSWPLI